jgi:hypothetical protein
VLLSGWTKWRSGDVAMVLATSIFMSLLWGPLAWKRLHESDE